MEDSGHVLSPNIKECSWPREPPKLPARVKEVNSHPGLSHLDRHFKGDQHFGDFIDTGKLDCRHWSPKGGVARALVVRARNLAHELFLSIGRPVARCTPLANRSSTQGTSRLDTIPPWRSPLQPTTTLFRTAMEDSNELREPGFGDFGRTTCGPLGSPCPTSLRGRPVTYGSDRCVSAVLFRTPRFSCRKQCHRSIVSRCQWRR